jgi:hypothetical protein
MSQPPYPPQGAPDQGSGTGPAQPPYGQQPYGQAPYGQQPPYGQPPWERPPATPATNRKLVIGLVAGVAVVIAALAVALVVGLRSDDGSGRSGSTIPDATSDPEGLGDDPELDDYAEECHDGDMQACDDLFELSPLDSAYELYGGSCAGRQPNAEARSVYCVDAFPPAS